MSVGPAYVGSSASGSASGSNWLDLRVVCLNGEGCILTLNPSTMGWEVRKMVAEDNSKETPCSLGFTTLLRH